MRRAGEYYFYRYCVKTEELQITSLRDQMTMTKDLKNQVVLDFKKCLLQSL